ncbi:MAG: sulfite exporter TauE/SafE family protein [Ideonella sp.]|nr:MAG: TSUP family transporter [Burkholderiaceae bacterium]MBE7427539.1 sulfite exporter TauE/SafE family protein [Ideonella sp.]
MDTQALLMQAPLLQWLGVALVAFAAAVLGGLAGYGTGLILPIALAPVIGVANVVPLMAVAMMINNGSRVLAFRREIAWPHVRRMLLLGLPACLLGAWGYTRLDTRAVALLLGLFLLASIPLRRALQRARRKLGARGEVIAGGAFGVIEGGMTGTGVILISMLMAAGVQGAALIATDAVISVAMSLAKALLFGGAARLDAALAVAGVLVGLCTAPGAFVARAILTRMPQQVHLRIMEAVVVCGGVGFLWRAWR